MLNAVKALDLQRDGRCAIHAHPGKDGDVKVAGIAVLERYIELTELVDDDGVRHRTATRAELARRGATMRPPARPAPSGREGTLAARLKRLRLAYCWPGRYPRRHFWPAT